MTDELQDGNLTRKLICACKLLARPFTRGGAATRKFQNQICATRIILCWIAATPNFMPQNIYHVLSCFRKKQSR